MNLHTAAVLLIASALAGAVNSVAGGGTLLTYPALLVALHNNGVVANATSTVALWPGQLSSLFGYRKEIGQNRRAILIMAAPSLVGGGIGALLLTRTSPGVFSHIVPYLILLATVLFMVQEPVTRRLRARAKPPDGSAYPVGDDDEETKFNASKIAKVIFFQFFVAVYGGYFGAGIGILMLAALGFLGFSNIHRMNGIKNINGLCINAVAITIFIFGKTPSGSGVGPKADSMIEWRLAALMMAGSIIGGYGGAGIARKIGQKNVRRAIICIGIALTLDLLYKVYFQKGS